MVRPCRSWVPEHLVQLGGEGNVTVADAAWVEGGFVVVGSFRGTLRLASGREASMIGRGAFVLRLDVAGADQWLSTLSATIGTWASRVARLPGGRFAVVGGYKGQLSSRSRRWGDATDSYSHAWWFVGSADTGALQPLWVTEGGTEQWGYGVAPAGAGGVYVGAFWGSVDLGTGVVRANPRVQAFVGWTDAAFVPRRVRQFGGTATDEFHDVVEAPGGRSIVGGSFMWSVDFGGGDRRTGGGDPNGVVVAFDEAGEHVWDTVFRGNNRVSVDELAVGGTEDVWAAGTWRGDVDFGGGMRTTSRESCFLVRLTSEGRYVWDAALNADGMVLTGLAVDDAGSAWMAGQGFTRLDRVGGGEVARFQGRGGFLVEFDLTGELANVRTYDGSGTDRMGGVAVGRGSDGQRWLAVTGSFERNAMLDTWAVTSEGGRDGFVALYRCGDDASP